MHVNTSTHTHTHTNLQNLKNCNIKKLALKTQTIWLFSVFAAINVFIIFNEMVHLFSYWMQTWMQNKVWYYICSFWRWLSFVCVFFFLISGSHLFTVLLLLWNVKMANRFRQANGCLFKDFHFFFYFQFNIGGESTQLKIIMPFGLLWKQCAWKAKRSNFAFVFCLV